MTQLSINRLEIANRALREQVRKLELELERLKREMMLPEDLSTRKKAFQVIHKKQKNSASA